MDPPRISDMGRRFTEDFFCIVQLILMSINPPSPPSGNIAMNESRNSLLEHVQPFQAHRLGSYPMNIISYLLHESYSYCRHNHCHMDSSTTWLIDRRAQTLIGQHLPPISLVSYDLMLTVLFCGI